MLDNRFPGMIRLNTGWIVTGTLVAVGANTDIFIGVISDHAGQDV